MISVSVIIWGYPMSTTEGNIISHIIGHLTDVYLKLTISDKLWLSNMICVFYDSYNFVCNIYFQILNSV